MAATILAFSEDEARGAAAELLDLKDLIEDELRDADAPTRLGEVNRF